MFYTLMGTPEIFFFSNPLIFDKKSANIIICKIDLLLESKVLKLSIFIFI